ncbi:MAG: hypothetical protein JWN04_1866, partial [Myxococcaceae bacterium]|nr:hypothetical protein [Myxococcaceae bacterium]
MSAQTFFVCELVEGSGKLSQCVQFKHPFLSNPMVGWT